MNASSCPSPDTGLLLVEDLVGLDAAEARRHLVSWQYVLAEVSR